MLESAAIGNLGIIQFFTGHLDEARQNYLHAVAHNRSAGHRRGEAIGLGNLGDIDIQLDRLDDATGYFRQAIQIFHEIGDQDSVAFALARSGAIHRIRGNAEDALRLANMALLTVRETGSWLGPITILQAKAMLDLGKLDDAATAAENALAIGRDSGDPQVEIDSLNVLANVEQHDGNVAAAITRHQEALYRADTLGLVHARIDALLGIADARLREKRFADASTAAERAVRISRTFGRHLHVRLARSALDSIGHHLQDSRKAFD